MAILPLSVIERREALARSLMGAGLQPNVSMGGWGGLAQAISGVAQTYAGTRLADSAVQDRATRSKQTREALAAALSGASTPYQTSTATAGEPDLETPANAMHGATTDALGSPAAAVTMDSTGTAGTQTVSGAQPVHQATPFRGLGGRQVDQRILDLAATLDESSDGEGTKFLTDYLTKPRNLHSVGRGGLYDESTGELVVGATPDKPEKPPASIAEYHQAQSDGFKGSYLDYRKSLAEGTHITVQPQPDRTLVEIADDSSPTGTRFVPREEAIGKPGKGSGRAKGVTAAQAASNDGIDTSRDVVEGYGQDRASLVRKVQPNIMDPSGTPMPNPEYDPFLAQHFRNAQRKKVGTDDGYKDFIGKYYPDAASAPAAAPSAPPAGPAASVTPPAGSSLPAAGVVAAGGGAAPPAAAAGGPKPGSPEEMTAPAIGHVTVDGKEYEVIGTGPDGRQRIRLGGKLGWY